MSATLLIDTYGIQHQYREGDPQDVEMHPHTDEIRDICRHHNGERDFRYSQSPTNNWQATRLQRIK